MGKSGTTWYYSIGSSGSSAADEEIAAGEEIRNAEDTATLAEDWAVNSTVPGVATAATLVDTDRSRSPRRRAEERVSDAQLPDQEDNDTDDIHMTAMEVTEVGAPASAAAVANKRGRAEDGLPPEAIANDFWSKMRSVIQEENDALRSQVQAVVVEQQVLASKQKATEKDVATLQTE